MSRRLTTEEFIEKAKAVHGDRYDYGLVEYVNSSTPVQVVCSKHGVFTPTPANHMRGSGCRRCANEKHGKSCRLTTEQFIRKAKTVHDDRYDYSRVTYRTSDDPVVIGCPDHGWFEQRAIGHLTGRGCKKCGLSKPLYGKRQTTEQFVSKARKVHGDRYDYGKVRYTLHDEAVSIVCSEHGVFHQIASVHLSGSGCQACAKEVTREKVTTSLEDFLLRANRVHGDEYDYSRVKELRGVQARIEIVCPVHGAWEQVASEHLRGRGCRKCGDERRSKQQRMSQDEFMRRARQTHGDRYDYTKTVYRGWDQKVVIGCATHGEFRQDPLPHLNGAGCRKCAAELMSQVRLLSTSQFITKAQERHGNRFDYSRVEYVGAKTPIIIGCPDHGWFEQQPRAHLGGIHGCRACGLVHTADSKRRSTEEFILQAQDIHGDRYDYSRAQYLSITEPVEIICRDHGAFYQVASDHLRGGGCRDCAEYGFDFDKPAVLYYVAVASDEGDTLYKVGITNRTVRERFSILDFSRMHIVKIWQFDIGGVAAKREAEILRRHAGDRYNGPPILSSGNTEIFTRDVLGLDT